MFVDSHCHLDFPDLVRDLDAVLAAMRKNEVGYGLCICVNLRDFHQVLAVAENHDNLYATVGIHPDYEDEDEATVQELVRLACHPKVVGIGETGLDYYRLKGDLEWQRERFRIHIRAAIESGRPLVIHTREAASDTLKIMREEGAEQVGGVMHCFTESWEVAQAAIEMGFCISFSGIVTFKNAGALKEIARKVPLDRMLIETDSPYLAPVPYRGKINQPAYVKYVAEEIARLRDIPVETVGQVTSANFFRLFKRAVPCG
jgi:TatD DNase family protein